MATELTAPGKTYVVVSSGPLTVTATRSGEELTLLTLAGEGTGNFTAVANSVIITTSDAYSMEQVGGAGGCSSSSGGDTPSIVVDQKYNPTSTNPQSGTAVAEALLTVEKFVPNQVVEYSGSYTGEAIIIPNGKILALSGLNGLALANLAGLSLENLGDGVYSTGECYIPAMATPPAFSWSPSLLWIDGQAATGKAPTVAANTAYRLALRQEGLQIFANLTYYNEL